MSGSRWHTVAALAGLVLLAPRRGDACSYGPMAPHTTDPAEAAVDSTPPSAIAKPSFTVQRGHGPEGGCGSQSSDSCADIGSISVHFQPASDDRTDAANMGYRVEVVKGVAPADSTWPSAAVRAHEGNTLYFHWADGESDEQEAIDFTLAISALDRAGNQGPATELRIRHGGSEEGCRATRSGVDLSWWLVAAALWALRRRVSRASLM
ncbi:MAG: hypothetical protein IPM35_25040 [Myxococcales bacterium]|nr:hypothetical protein [Myxococcales bacterium]